MLISSSSRDFDDRVEPAGVLRYTSPATRWFEALPIGNGRLSGMVYGGTDAETIGLSESTAWSGAPSENDVNPAARENLARIRELLFAGDYAAAQELSRESLLGRPRSFGTNLPLPEVVLRFENHGSETGYERTLDLDTATVKTDYVRDGIRFQREAIASNPHGLIAVRLTASAPACLSFDLAVRSGVIPGRISAADATVTFDGHAYETMHSNGREGVAVLIRARVIAEGGKVETVGDGVRVKGADAATIFIAVGTDWMGADPSSTVSQLLDRAIGDGYDAVRSAHVDDHRELMRRSSLRLGLEAPAAAATLPTDERHRLLADGGIDDELVALYYQYGRYLTIAGSRKNSPLPLALQGQWNDGLASSASWTNDFHLDMNTQQNYWAAEPTGLGECQEPLFSLIELIARTGRGTASEMYRAQGWVAHTVTNAWGYTAPGSGEGWGLNVTGGAWIALQLWEHFEYNRDLDFLRHRAYPVFREAALFFLTYLVAEPQHGWLVAGPSDSPENWYTAPDGTRSSVAMGNTVDRVFAEAILRICREASELLDVDRDLRAQIDAVRDLLPPFQIGRHGQLQEWLHDYEEADPAHRHTSHLCALYPERQIGPRTTPELARAAAVTIERRRAAPGWEQTEWVEANFTVYYARLLDGDRALEHLTSLITDASETNLMSFSAGGVAGAAQNIYSFDGNAGGTAGIAEMLVQSDGKTIELLPALPTAWPDGEVSGLRAKGGYELAIRWRRGRLESAHIRTISAAARPRVTVRLADEFIELDLGTVGEATIGVEA
ncbi:glycoside hydrolase family 95 protein [Diaminobutyricibacter tongyongensis]|uniref:Glycoside hydrolase family 95 protein n=1 Tax=Leifsonia tongyongensis TaxID=1268043 RepID=A0A6L9XVP9_9MICO|nr:glycoside hydrolase family 95 protein [Diaminobutyricibacter tongyongensis]NEN05307.1 glycoside hydrolase family 95 protein [Diaminobutyricibacter tongyongensis]